MTKVTVNGKEVNVEPGLTVLQACEVAGVEIPRFCYHERLSVAGNCRMCLVEVEKSPKPVASCAMPVAENMVIHTNTQMVKKAREGVMEFLLINHPLDCPICDQGGECDLQDEAMAYGRGTNRFAENKRSVAEKYMGPLIKTHMTRCIHCTRCIRFSTEVAGVEDLGAFGRGEHMEVGTYVERAIRSELSGNLVDICPVGALTSKPYAFKARSWELTKTESIDVMDAVGSNIRVDSRGMEVMRILPRLNEEINEEWISDKTRHACDGLKMQRLDRAYMRQDGKLAPAKLTDAMEHVAALLKETPSDAVGFLLGGMVDAEAMVVLKAITSHLNMPHLDSRPVGLDVAFTERSHYLFNTTIEGIEKADCILLVGANPRHEATMVNARIKKRTRKPGCTIAAIGAIPDQTYPVMHLGNDAVVLEALLEGKGEFAAKMQAAKHGMIIVGESALTRSDGQSILTLAYELAEKNGWLRADWHGVNVLHKAAARVAGLDLGMVPGKKGMNAAQQLEAAKSGALKLLLLVGEDDAVSKLEKSQLADTLVVYVGHHGDAGAHLADIILPGAAYTEKNATYVNLEGRVQRTHRAVSPPGEAMEDWQLWAKIAEIVGVSASFLSLSEVRGAMVKLTPSFAQRDVIIPSQPRLMAGKTKKTLLKATLSAMVPDYYMMDAISRHSPTMAKCAELFSKDLTCQSNNEEAA
jgi:NADH-quinone oxidoreductase subunit G